MKTLILALVLSTCAAAQSLSFYIDTSDGSAPVSSLTPLPATYAFPDTSVGQSASLTVRLVNSSASTVQLNAIYVGAATGSSAADSNFAVTGLENATLAPGDFKLFFLSFTPSAAGAASGYLQVSIAGQQPAAVSTLSGNGLSSSVTLTCVDPLAPQCDGKTPLQQNSSINFGPAGGVLPGATYPITFALANFTSAPIAVPSISSTNYAVGAFSSPDLATLPPTIAPGSTVTFSVIYTPQISGPGSTSPTLQTAALQVGTASYTLQGSVATTSDNDPPTVKCVSQQTGQPCASPASSTYSLGPDSSSLTALFTITNPEILGTPYANITLPSVPTISGAGFAVSTATIGLTGSASPGTPVAVGQTITIQPGYSLTFQVAFTGSTASTGTLTITYAEDSGDGTPGANTSLTYILNAEPPPPVGSAGSDLPGLALMCGASPCTSQTFGSQQHVQATLTVSAATTALVPLSISFASSITGVAGDPAVTFISPVNSNNIGPISFTPSSLTGTLSNGQSQFTFQTGTTAGTITITATDPATQQPYTWTIPILPSKVQITSSTAVRQSPNLILTIEGYDNTYSAGPLSFTFDGLTGTVLTPNAIQVNATSAFSQYFLGSTNQAGGAFSLEVSFPVDGDVTQVGSVTATISNSAGQSSVSSIFQ